MDETIRSILQEALVGGKNEDNLMNAYSKLKRGQQSSDQSNPFAADVYVICAETAYQLKKFDVAEDCLKMYFQKAESGNECLGRAYMCQAQLNQPESAKFHEQLEKCASFLLKAINFGKVNKKQHHLVYNGSVLYWSFARPFLKPNCQFLLAKTLHQIVKALDDIDDKDYEWRAQLMVSLIECYIDGGRKEDASQVSIAAASFAKAYCPQMYKMILTLQIQHKLIDQPKLLKDAKQSTDVVIYLRILKLKSLIDSGEKVDVDAELDRLYRTIMNDGIEPQGTGRSTRMSQTTSNGPISQSEKFSLMLDLIKLCLEYEKVSLAEEYASSAMGGAKDSIVALEFEFLKSEIVAHKLKAKKSQYTKTCVEKRMDAIKKLEDSLATAIRLRMPTLIQVGCVTMWNLCLPLLQKDFRKAIKAPLSLVTEALEDIDSLLLLMRCEIHIELAKCEEGNEQLESAMNHLRKALVLDDTGLYKNRIEGCLHKLELRSMLYRLPDRPEDLAALIIEQARTTKEAGKLQMKRASLVKAGLALAPDSFGLVLDGETGLSLPRSGPTNPQQLAEMVTRYQKSVSVISGHIKRLGNENERERAHIWADLVKTARKQKVWDVTRVAAKFCLLYDDGRWEGANRAPSVKEESKATQHGVNGNGNHHGASGSHGDGGNSGKRSVTETEQQSQDETDLMLMIAEIHFIYAEAIVQLLQAEGVKLLSNPSPVEDLSAKPKSREGNTIKVANTQEWNAYSNWVQSLCETVLKGFHRGAKLGATLNAPWLVNNAGIYLWNYTNHILSAGNFSRLIDVFQPVYDDLKILGYLEDVPFFCELSHALARGYMQQHTPNSRQASPVQGEKEKKVRGGKQSASPTYSKSKTFVPVNDPEALTALKQALEILEHALNLTNGTDSRCLVPIAVRHPLIKTWALCKMLVGQLLPKNLGHDDETPSSQGPMSKALCAVEAHVLQQKYGFDMTNCPGLFETMKLVENCVWTDRLVEMETWTCLASLASKSSFCQIVIQCGEKALELGNASKPVNFERLNDVMKHKYKVEQELLYYSSMLMGENLVAIMHGRNETRHKALNHFANACKFATKAKNYKLTVNAAQHYWNTCQSFILTPIERKLLKEPIKGMLKCMTEVWKYAEMKENDDQIPVEKEDDEKIKKSSSEKEVSTNAKKNEKKSKKSEKQIPSSGSRVRIGCEEVYEPPGNSKTQMDLNLSLRAALYGVLFQIYADMGEWKSGLKAMDEAVKVMPRTHHRLLIFKHRVIVNARLGNPVQFDMGKFKDTDELVLSSMWYRVAKNSNDPRDQLIAFQNSIQCLQDTVSKWQKVEYLSEFAEWLFVNEFPLQDCLDHLHMALDLVTDGIKSENLLVPLSGKSNHKNANDRKDMEMRTLINDCIDIRSLEGMVRLHVMIAKVLESNSRDWENHALTAAYCVQKLWQNAIRNGEKAVRDGVKPGERPFSRTESKRRDVNKIEKQSSKTCLPVTFDQWVNFTLPEKLKEHFSRDTYGYFISRKSLVKPELTIHYLEMLIELLRTHGHHSFLLPICSLFSYISEEVLNDKFLITLAKLQLLDVLQDLQMTSAISNIFKSLNLKYITEEDKADSREEILIWKEKQAQVKAAQMKQEAEKKSETLSTADSKTVEFCRNKKLIRGISKREVWSKIAGYLVKQGQYNEARELLDEAKMSAEAFDDTVCLAHVEYNYALIAYHECDWGVAVSHLETIQDLEESLDFWLEVILLRVDSYQRSLDLSTTFHSHPEAETDDMAIKLVNSTVGVIVSLCKSSPNKFSQGKIVIAALKSRLAEYLFKTCKEIDEKAKIQIAKLLEESLEIYNKLGHRRNAVKVIKQQVYLHQLKASTSLGEKKKISLMKCLEISKEAVSIARETIGRVELPVNELRNICLPIEEELADSLLQTMCISLEILKEMTIDIKRTSESLSRKDSVDKMLDAFVAATPVFTEREQEWNSVTKVIGEETLSLLNFIFSFCEKFPKHQARASLYLGKCLHQIAIQKFPELDNFDASKAKELLDENLEGPVPSKPEKGSTLKEYHKDGNEESDVTDEKLSSLNVRQKEKADVIKRKYAVYSMLITQAAEYLLLAVQLGLRNGFKDIILRSSYELVECIGTRDQSMSAQYLALHQSAKAAVTVGEKAQRLFLDPHLSRVAGLTQQRKTLNAYASNASESVGIRGLNLESIQTESEAWRRLHVARNHLELIKDLPFSITFVILQHSPDNTTIHAAVLEKPKSSVQTGKKKDASVGVINRTRICSSKVSRKLLDELTNLAEQFKSDVSSLLLRKRYFKQQLEKRKEMLGSIEKTPSDTKAAVSFENEINAEEKRLQASFEHLIVAMEGYFGKTLGHIQESLLQEPAADTVLILADADLLQLPLEALPIFRQSYMKSVSRDFSLQVFYHRITQGELSDQQNGKADKNRFGKKDKLDVKAKSEKAVASSKKGKQPAKELVFGKDGILLDMSNLRYIVDPSCDWPSGDKDGPETVMADLIAQLKNKSAKWIGLNGHEKMQSIPELQRFIQDSPSLLFYGFERFFAHIPPQFVAPLCLTDCHLIALLDNMKTIKSSLRQGNLDARKCPVDLALERPFETAVTLSLCGAPCILLNQWQCEVNDNSVRLHSVIEGLCENSCSVGQALHNSRNPMKDKSNQQPIIREEADSVSEKASSSQGKHKSDGKTSKLQHRTSQAESLRSSKVSSPTSSTYNKKEGKLKAENAWKERNESKLQQEQGKCDDSCESLLPFERYNMVLYGLPNFSTTLQGGTS